mgnify:CR=1 FL=1
MTFKEVLPNGVCGKCNERPRPSLLQRQHAAWWDFVLGCYVECPDCGNVFEPGTWNSSGEKAKYVKTDTPAEPVAFGRSLIEKMADTE